MNLGILWQHQAKRDIRTLEKKCMKDKCKICNTFREYMEALDKGIYH